MAERPDEPGWVLPLLLFGGFRTLIDRLHVELARQGHPDVRPAYGFAMQAIGRDGATASGLGRRLGVSKQAAGAVTGTGWMFALIPIMFTYSGWNASAYMAEEIRNPGRNLPLSLALGTAAVRRHPPAWARRSLARRCRRAVYRSNA